MIPRPTMEEAAQATERLIQATKLLSIQELGELVDHLGEGTLEEVKNRTWGHHVAGFLPADGDSAMIHFMWVALIDVHSDALDEQ